MVAQGLYHLSFIVCKKTRGHATKILQSEHD
jgi:hypothetical protein